MLVCGCRHPQQPKSIQIWVNLCKPMHTQRIRHFTCLICMIPSLLLPILPDYPLDTRITGCYYVYIGRTILTSKGAGQMETIYPVITRGDTAGSVNMCIPTVTTHRSAGTNITHVAVDGITDNYFSVEKCGKWFYVRMDNTPDGYSVGYSRGYDTQREALAECVDRIVRDRRIDAEREAQPSPEPDRPNCHSCGHPIKAGNLSYDGYGQPWHRGCWLETYDGSESTLDYYRA